MKQAKIFIYKYGLKIVVMALSLVGLVLFFRFLTSYVPILLALAYVVSFIAFIDILNKKTNPEFITPWVCIVLLFPLIGTLIYALFYEKKTTKKEMKHYMELKDLYAPVMKDKKYDKEGIDDLTIGKINNLLKEDYLSNVFRDTKSKYYGIGEDMFPDIIEDLKKAKEFIFLEYFIIESGVMWDAILEILKEKAKAGVEIKMLYDDVGCSTTLPENYDKQLRKLGIKCYTFNKIKFNASPAYNNRDHRKILVIDGKVGYTGGINFADEYINKVVKHGYWKDGGIRIEGDAVKGLSRMFLLNYDITCNTITDFKKYEKDYKVKSTGLYIPFDSGPGPLYQTAVGEGVFLNMINQAIKYVYITTPYLIIDYNLSEALKKAAKRGVDVRIITPGIGDKKIIQLTTRGFYNELIEAGVKIYEYVPGFIHLKALICDDIYGVVGTINFDYRSFVHNYEDAIFMYKTNSLEEVKTDIMTTVEKDCKEMNIKKLNFAHRTILRLTKLFIVLF